MTQLLPLQNFPSDLSFLETLVPSLDKTVTKCYKKFLNVGYLKSSLFFDAIAKLLFCI